MYLLNLMHRAKKNTNGKNQKQKRISAETLVYVLMLEGIPDGQYHHSC